MLTNVTKNSMLNVAKILYKTLAILVNSNVPPPPKSIRKPNIFGCFQMYRNGALGHNRLMSYILEDKMFMARTPTFMKLSW